MTGRGNWHGTKLPQWSRVMAVSEGHFMSLPVLFFNHFFFIATDRNNTNVHFVQDKIPTNILVPGRQSFTWPTLSDLVFGFSVSEISSTAGHIIKYFFFVFHFEHQGSRPLQSLSVYCRKSDKNICVRGGIYTQEPQIILKHSNTNICVVNT